MAGEMDDLFKLCSAATNEIISLGFGFIDQYLEKQETCLERKWLWQAALKCGMSAVSQADNIPILLCFYRVT